MNDTELRTIIINAIIEHMREQLDQQPEPVSTSQSQPFTLDDLE